MNYSSICYTSVKSQINTKKNESPDLTKILSEQIPALRSKGILIILTVTISFSIIHVVKKLKLFYYLRFNKTWRKC